MSEFDPAQVRAELQRLDITGLRIWQEIQPGLPSCVTLADPALVLVLKWGSFGSANFLSRRWSI